MFAINEPCHENWSEMTPQEQGRHCAKCDKVVVDFTALDPDEGLAILEEAATSADNCRTGICGRVHADAAGRLQLGQQKSSIKKRLLSDAMAGMLALSVLGGCYQSEESVHQAPLDQGPLATQHASQQATQPHTNTVVEPMIMGDICVELPPEPIKGKVIELRGEIEVQPE